MEHGTHLHPFVTVSNYNNLMQILFMYFIIEPCGNPTSIKNGEVTVSGRIPRSNATYFCDNNYQLIGNPTVICHSNSHWIGKVPKCKRMYV